MKPLHFPSLVKIDLSQTTVNSFQVQFLILKCKMLSEISLKNCRSVTDHVFEAIHFEADLTGEIPVSADSLQSIDLSHSACTEKTIFCLLDENIFPCLASVTLEGIRMMKNNVTEILSRQPTAIQLPSPCPYLFGMLYIPDQVPDRFADFGPDLTDYFIMDALFGEA